MVDYERFLQGKAAVAPPVGIEDVPSLSERLFPFQRDIVAWALRRGRAAIFADTGLGKTRMQLEWARVVAERAGRVLLLAPLAVAKQTVREGESIGIAVRYARSIADAGDAPIVIANYEMLVHFDAADFAGVVLDESSILKAYDGKTRTAIIESFAATPFRLACTATPAPNDHVELGNHSEFLGVKNRVEMLAEYFVHDGGETQSWRLKGHAQRAFWEWVCSWGVSVKRPSDLGYDDEGYLLPELDIRSHVIPGTVEQARRAGMLFVEPAKALTEQRAARRASLPDRIRLVSEIVAAEPGESWIVWCELNDESAALTKNIAGAVEIKGADKPEAKEQRMLDFAEGKIRVLVTKPSIAGFGMNWQHAARVAFAGVSHSYEDFYQAIRRCWRFGQKRPVHVHVVTSELDGAVLANLKRKEADAQRMADEMVAAMRETTRAAIRAAAREVNTYKPARTMRVPAWLRSDAA